MTKSPFHPTRKASLTETATERLRAQIKTENLSPGDPLPKEKDLCIQHDVSRTVIREALATLKADGLVIAKHGVGFFVADPSRKPLSDSSGFDLGNLKNVSSVLNVLELRIGVETEAAALAAQRRSPAQEAHIQECYERLKLALESEELDSAQPDHAFHHAVAEATNNPIYVDFLDYIIDAALKQVFDTGYGANEARRLDKIDILLSEHREIVDAISDKDADRAYGAMREHLEKSATRFRQLSYHRSAT
ncbi:FadR/GntR family transcriptional regulator [Thalassospira lucentensis]|uniref:FadR/GntR family transcriptional regulator n=1 Tax=Thalassospira lucentensis TaxID=168935 RepID=UPI003D2EE48A